MPKLDDKIGYTPWSVWHIPTYVLSNWNKQNDRNFTPQIMLLKIRNVLCQWWRVESFSINFLTFFYCPIFHSSYPFTTKIIFHANFLLAYWPTSYAQMEVFLEKGKKLFQFLVKPSLNTMILSYGSKITLPSSFYNFLWNVFDDTISTIVQIRS